ncbi:dirigent protein 11-like [Salvia miltiorrhiza]|uniref:dirigent protein 11-like n=1 Tax=Salvia miltiorrhiza TaxID=226208 RepID=UPI0025AC6996|nr:dirigent protein 11-like [Salvia miltiorrhiza]
MAKLAIALILIISYLSVCTLAVSDNSKLFLRDGAEEQETFLRDVCGGKEKVMKLHFYVQDLRIGHVNATVFEVAKASITPTHPTAFGSVHVLDDLITEGPKFGSRALGRTQGLTTNADLATFGIAMNLNFYFTVGRFAGSTLSILGRNQVMDAQRELPVVGGTGVFRFARGYAIQSTYSIDFPTSYAVLEYTIYTTYNSRLNEIDDEIEIAQM